LCYTKSINIEKGGVFMTWLVWLIVAGVFVIIEMLTVGFLALFFGFAALLTSVFSLAVQSLPAQIIFFIVVSVASIFFGKPILQKYFNVNKEVKASTIDAVIGQTGFVIKAITQGSAG